MKLKIPQAYIDDLKENWKDIASGRPLHLKIAICIHPRNSGKMKWMPLQFYVAITFLPWTQQKVFVHEESIDKPFKNFGNWMDIEEFDQYFKLVGVKSRVYP